MSASAQRTSSSSAWKSSLKMHTLSLPFSSWVEHAPQPLQRPMFMFIVLTKRISAFGSASRQPKRASLHTMSQFEFFLPNEMPKIFISLPLDPGPCPRQYRRRLLHTVPRSASFRKAHTRSAFSIYASHYKSALRLLYLRYKTPTFPLIHFFLKKRSKQVMPGIPILTSFPRFLRD